MHCSFYRTRAITESNWCYSIMTQSLDRMIHFLSIYSYKRCSIIRFYLITAAMNDFVVFQIGDSNMTSLKQRSEYKSKKQTIDEMMTFKDSDLDKHGNSISVCRYYDDVKETENQLIKMPKREKNNNYYLEHNS
eukprot:233912_1